VRSIEQREDVHWQIVIYTSARVKCICNVLIKYIYSDSLYISSSFDKIYSDSLSSGFDKIYSDSLGHQVLIKYIATLFDKIYSDSLYHQVLIK
jgi:uncharacterized protein YccT (UPF0319 family)